MFDRMIFCELKKELIEVSKDKDHGFVSLCLDAGNITMNYNVHASDISIDDENIFIETDKFIIHISINNSFKIEKNINDFEKEYVLEDERFKLYMMF